MKVSELKPGEKYIFRQVVGKNKARIAVVTFEAMQGSKARVFVDASGVDAQGNKTNQRRYRCVGLTTLLPIA
jgi:hypothetical protein